MRGPDHVGSRHIATLALGGALLTATLPGQAVAAASEPAALPLCMELGASAARASSVTSPWEVMLDEDGVVTGHRLTLRKGDREQRVHTGPRGFAVSAGADRMLIGERSDRGTRLDMVDTARVCRLWTRLLGRHLHPARATASGGLRLSAHARDSRRYEGTHVLDPESGNTSAIVEETCLESCHPTDGDMDLAALSATTVVRPTPNFAGGAWAKDKKLTFRWKPGAVPPSWARSPLKSGAADATESSASRSPDFAYTSSGANAVAYSGNLASFCGGSAIACAGRSMPTYWGIWIRPYGTEFAWGTLRWCQKTSSSSGCFDLRRVMVHELGHITGLNHPSASGFTLAPGDSIMQAITPMRPRAGASRHAFGRCDVATLQELYDTPNNRTSISTCNDVATQVWLSTSDQSITRGTSVKLVATLKVTDQSAYRELAANPLNGRSLKLKYRRAGSSDDWKTVWMRPTYRKGRYEASLTPGSTWEFKAVFDRPTDEGLRYSRSEIRKVKVID